MLKTLIIVSIFAASAFGSAASAREGHWSIGQGVQCHNTVGGVVCSGVRP